MKNKNNHETKGEKEEINQIFFSIERIRKNNRQKDKKKKQKKSPEWKKPKVVHVIVKRAKQ